MILGSGIGLGTWYAQLGVYNWPPAESGVAVPPDGPTYSATYQRSATYDASFQQSADAYAATYQVTKTYESEWD